MRLGAYDAELKPGSKIAETLRFDPHQRSADVIRAPPGAGRHGTFAGMSARRAVAGTIEYPDHPWFIGVQYHPELKSKPFEPHPLFCLLHRRGGR